MNKLVRTYPFPVLRPDSDDFIDAEFSVDCETELLPTDKYSLVFSIVNTCPELKALVEDGKAVYTLRIICKTTMYRKTVTFIDEKYTVEIPRTDLLNEVSIYPMIISLEDIDNYSCDAFNPDYKGVSISVSVGDSLGVAKPICFDAQPQNEIGETPESIIKFGLLSNQETVCVSVADDSDYIYIKLRDDMRQKVFHLSNIYSMQCGKESLIWSLFAIPALTEVLAKWFSRNALEESQAEAKAKMWFRVIRDKFESLEIIEVDRESGDIVLDARDFESIAAHPFEYAELLISSPLISSVENLFNMSTQVDDEGEMK